MALQFEHLLFEIKDQVAWITLDRPEQHNAFIGDLRDELLQALLHVQEDETIRVAVLTGAGRFFSAGSDLRQMAEMKDEEAGFERLRPHLDAGRRLVSVLHQMPKPVVAMVNGPASGAGCNLALACDIRIAADNAYFSQNFVKMGLHPDWGGSYFLPRLVGTGRALELMWTGRRIEAEEAEEMGLVQQVVPHPHLREHTTRFVRRLAQAPADAVRLIKLAVYNSLQYDLDGMLDFEHEAQQQCWNSADSREGLRAATERRRAIFDRP